MSTPQPVSFSSEPVSFSERSEPSPSSLDTPGTMKRRYTALRNQMELQRLQLQRLLADKHIEKPIKAKEEINMSHTVIKRTVYAVFGTLAILTLVAKDIAPRVRDENCVATLFAKLAPPTNQTTTADAAYCRGDEVKCEIWDHYELVRSTRKEVFVTTLAKYTEEERSCGRDELACQHPIWVDNDEKKEERRCTSCTKRRVYTAQPERYRLVLEHALRTSFFGSRNHNEMEGVLLAPDGTVLQELGAGNRDELELSTVLAAAGVDLDAPATHALAHTKKRKTHRDEGVTLELQIHYTNVQGSDTLTYEVRATHFASMAAKKISTEKQPTAWSGAERRMKLTLNGISLLVVQTDSVRQWRWSKLIDTARKIFTNFDMAKTIIFLMVGKFILRGGRGDGDRRRSISGSAADFSDGATPMPLAPARFKSQ